MKKPLFLFVSMAAMAISVCAQSTETFPGVSAANLKQLQSAKRFTAIPLPTWIPAGFKLEKIESKLGPRVKIEERILAIVYSRALPNGKVQRFSFEAGFDGLGDLMYDTTKVIPSSLGKIYLVYEPQDPDEGKKRTNFAMTEWFDVGKTAFHYNGMFGANENDTSNAMISLQDTDKILRSVKRF